MRIIEGVGFKVAGMSRGRFRDIAEEDRENRKLLGVSRSRDGRIGSCWEFCAAGTGESEVVGSFAYFSERFAYERGGFGARDSHLFPDGARNSHLFPDCDRNSHLFPKNAKRAEGVSGF